MFLSDNANAALEELVRESWQVAQNAMHDGEQIDATLGLVRKAEVAVLAAAKDQLGAG